MSLGSNYVFITLNPLACRLVPVGWWQISDPSGIWNEDPCIRGEKGYHLLIFNSTIIWSKVNFLQTSTRHGPSPTLSSAAAFPACHQCTKVEKLHGQYLLLVCLAHSQLQGEVGGPGGQNTSTPLIRAP